MESALDSIRNLKYPKHFDYEGEEENEEEPQEPEEKVLQYQLNYLLMAHELIQNQLYNSNYKPHLKFKEQFHKEENEDEEEEERYQYFQQAKDTTKKYKFPVQYIRSAWMGHDLQHGKSFRCDTYHETLFWNQHTKEKSYTLEEW